MRLPSFVRAVSLSLLALVATLLVVTQVRADTYAVTNTNDSGAGSLRQAILDANAHAGADTITFNLSGCPCVITLTSALPDITDTLTIQGSGAVNLTINGNGQRVFRVLNSALFTLADVTVANGHSASGGGAVYNSLSRAVVVNTVFISNSATFGGAIYNSGVTATLSVSGCTLLSNTANFGGGLYNNSGFVTITNSSFYSNTATAPTGLIHGGGLASENGSLTIVSSTLAYNRVPSPDTRNAEGGGGYVAGGSLQVISSTFAANSTSCQSCQASIGGGLRITSTQAVTITDSRFVYNNSWEGGGLAFNGCATGSRQPIVIQRSTFQTNYAAYGGGLKAACADARIKQSRFEGNESGSGRGGGMYVTYDTAQPVRSTLRLEESTVINNIGQTGSGLQLDGLPSFLLLNNIIADNRLTWHDRSGAIEIDCASDSIGALAHNTLARNTGSQWGSYGVMVRGGYPAVINLDNNIVVSHTLGVSATQGVTVVLVGTLFGTGTWANEQDYGGVGHLLFESNVWGDPHFADPTAHDYHIGAGSAAIDRGIDRHFFVDIDNQPRPIGLPDIGADEWGTLAYLPLILK